MWTLILRVLKQVYWHMYCQKKLDKPTKWIFRWAIVKPNSVWVRKSSKKLILKFNNFNNKTGLRLFTHLLRNNSNLAYIPLRNLVEIHKVRSKIYPMTHNIHKVVSVICADNRFKILTKVPLKLELEAVVWNHVVSSPSLLLTVYCFVLKNFLSG